MQYALMFTLKCTLIHSTNHSIGFSETQNSFVKLLRFATQVGPKGFCWYNVGGTLFQLYSCYAERRPIFENLNRSRIVLT